MLNKKLMLLSFAAIMLPSISLAEPGTIKGRKPASLTILATRGDESVRTDASSESNFELTLPESSESTRLNIIDSTGSLGGTVVLAIKRGGRIYSVTSARAQKICRKASAVAITGLKVSDDKIVNVGQIKANDERYSLKRALPRKRLDTNATAEINNRCELLTGSDNPGLGTSDTARIRKSKREALGVTIKVGDDKDSDGDGLVEELDVDDDGDGVLDNYDSDTVSNPSAVRIFSNLKLSLENSVNVKALRNAGSVSETQIQTSIDSAMEGTTTLAIQVAGESGDTVELNCGALGYCSAEGTGQASVGGSFPGTVGNSTFDSDADGFGTIVEGGTGDFQLRTGATSSEIGAGDVMTEIVTPSVGDAYQVSGIINFVFNTTPAIKTAQVNSDTATTITYPAVAGNPGTTGNCLAAPSTGDVSLTLNVWRPERPAIAGAGETDFMDVGNSIITIDLPNAPAGGSGPGNCVRGYSESDDELSLATDGSGNQTLTDSAGDRLASTSNTVTFSINLTTCLNNPSAGSPVSWSAGQTLLVDVQFRNSSGDNAAQKICVTRST